MSKRVPFATKFRSWKEELTVDERKNFELSDSNIFCNVCSRMFSWDRKSQLVQHIASGIHQKSVGLQTQSGLRQGLVTAPPLANEFYADLSKAFLSADIPWKKLENPNVKEFLEKYTKREIPTEKHLRTKYLPLKYEEIINSIRIEAADSKIWLAIDETTDSCGRFMVNVIIGCLSISGSDNPHLIMSREVHVANNVTITQLIMDALHFIWPGKMEAEINKRFVALLSDAAPYMIKAGKNLKNTYPDLLHITCLAHALHRVAEAVRGKFKDVDKLLASVKAVFKKTTSRKRLYKEAFPDLPLPPEPVLTRWGTWLDAAAFYSTNYTSIKSIVDQLDEDDAASIKSAQKLLRKESVKNELADIQANFAFLSEFITKLEERGLSIVEAVEIIQKVSDRLIENKSSIGVAIFTKLQHVLQKNPDFSKIKNVAQILNGESSTNVNMDPDRIAALKYCPLTSVEVERSFSMVKSILAHSRHRFTVENLEMDVICHYELNNAKN